MATTIELNPNLFTSMRNFRHRIRARGLWFGLILLGALVAFELFNFATTEFALQTLFGARDALGVATWAKVLAIAFCGIDFAGLARLFTPETGRKEPKEIWLLTGAWFLGASMNALMTWWGVGSALSENPALGNELLTRQDVLLYGPIFIAVLVWVTRILIIGTFAFAGDHIFTTADRRATGYVEGTARPVGRSESHSHEERRGLFGRGESRAVPKPSSAPALGQPLASSSYARAADTSGERRVYDASRSLFGRGAGESTRPGYTTSSVPTPPAYAEVARPEPVASASYTGRSEPRSPAAESREPDVRRSGVTSLWASDTPREGADITRTQTVPAVRDEPPRYEPPQVESVRAEPAPAARGAGPVRSHSGRASSIRTRPAGPSRPESSPRPASPSTQVTQPGLELEYVELD